MIICSSCYAECPDEANYCQHCGTYLKSTTQSNNKISTGNESLLSNETMTQALRRLMPTSYVEKLLATKGQVEGERRVVTILFSDIKGSTSLAENLDPEEVLEIMNGAFDVLIEPIARYEGTLARLMGDAILAFFGAPIAHEDDPYRACRAALDILQGAQKFSQKLEYEKGIEGFSVRVGINTGLVVVAEVGADLRVEYTAMGDAVNVAARMESAAEPGSILITEATKRLISNDFKITRVGPIKVKGKTKPIESFKVIGLLEKNKKIEVVGNNFPIIGRRSELQKIQNTIKKLKQGKGNIISIIGDQGIGKTRLVSEIHKLLSSGVKWAEGRALSYTQKNSYWVARTVLKDYLGLNQETPEETMPGALRNMLKSKSEDEIQEIYSFLLHFLNIPFEKKFLETGPLENSATLKGRIHFAIKSFIKEESIKQPLVLVWEDLHWSDSPSLQLLNELCPLTKEFPILFLLVYRINETEGEIWNFHYNDLITYNDKHEVITLNALESEECAIMINNILKDQKISKELENQIIDRTEGNPFFINELMRSLIDRQVIKFENEAGHSITTVEELQVPDLLHSIIMSRIDSLVTSEKLMLQTASAIGRVFQKRLLARIMEKKLSDIDFEKSLKELQLREFVLRHLPTNMSETKLNIEKEYIIKDNLVYDVVYSTLLLSQREKLHKEIGEAIESLFTNHDSDFVEILADHFEKGKDLDKSFYYNRKAAERAKKIFASDEAIHYYKKTLALAEKINIDPHNLAEVLESLGEVYFLIAKYRIAIEEYNKSLSFYKEPYEKARIKYKCGQVYERWGKYEKALELFNNSLNLMDADSENLHSALIYAGMGMVYYRQGNYSEANSLNTRALHIMEKVGSEFEIADVFNNLGIIHCKMGDLLRSLEYHKKCLEIRENVGHLSGLAASYNNLGYVHQLQNDLDTAVQHFNKSIELSEKIGNHHGLARTYNNLSQLYNDQGKEKLAIDYNLKAITIFAEIAKDGLEMNSAVLRQTGVW